MQLRINGAFLVDVSDGVITIGVPFEKLDGEKLPLLLMLPEDTDAERKATQSLLIEAIVESIEAAVGVDVDAVVRAANHVGASMSRAKCRARAWELVQGRVVEAVVLGGAGLQSFTYGDLEPYTLDRAISLWERKKAATDADAAGTTTTTLVKPQ